MEPTPDNQVTPARPADSRFFLFARILLAFITFSALV